eukprot:756246-Hanusia_phi.AAC.4
MAEGDGYGEASAFGSMAGDSTTTLLLFIIILILVTLIVLKEIFDRFFSGQRKDSGIDRYMYGALDTADGSAPKEQNDSNGTSAASKASSKSVASPAAIRSPRQQSSSCNKSEGKSVSKYSPSPSSAAKAGQSALTSSSSKKKGKGAENGCTTYQSLMCMLADVDDDEDNLDDLWEENIPLKLQEKLENIGSNSKEEEPKMEFDRTTVAVGSWKGNEDILDDFESPLQSPKRSDGGDDDDVEKRGPAFTLNDEEVDVLFAVRVMLNKHVSGRVKSPGAKRTRPTRRGPKSELPDKSMRHLVLSSGGMKP